MNIPNIRISSYTTHDNFGSIYRPELRCPDTPSGFCLKSTLLSNDPCAAALPGARNPPLLCFSLIPLAERKIWGFREFLSPESF